MILSGDSFRKKKIEKQGDWSTRSVFQGSRRNRKRWLFNV